MGNTFANILRISELFLEDNNAFKRRKLYAS